MSIPKEDLKYLTDKQRKSLKDKKMPESQALQWIADQKKIENALKDEATKIINVLKDSDEQFIEYLEEDVQISLELAFTEAMDDIKMITGDKTITYTSINSSNVFQINRNVEDEDQDLENLESSLYYTIGNYDSAAIIIREYPLESTNSSNIKNIYGMIINGDDYRWLKEEEVFEAMNTDNKTGELLEPDTTLNYCGFYFKK